MTTGAPKVVVTESLDDPLANIERYLRLHVSADSSVRVDAYLEDLRRNIAANRETDLHCAALVSALPPGDRADAEALVADLPVLLTQRRNQLLRDAHAGTLTADAMDRCFQDVCMSTHAPLDPDLPKIAAQAIVRRSSQTALMARAVNALDGIRTAWRSHPATVPTVAPLLSLGRFLAFLRWIPYDWAEEITLDVLATVHPATRIDRLRLWISVFRVFFCRPSVSGGSLIRLLNGVEDEFGWPAPMEIRALMRSVLIKGGEESERILLRRFDEQPARYETAHFLDIMAMINKPVTAARLLKRKSALLAGLGADTYLQLLTRTGESTPEARDLLVTLWDHGGVTTRGLCLDTVRELHFCDMAHFLLSRLPLEQDLSLRFQLVETVAASAGSDDLRRLATRMRNERSVLRYYAIHLIHRRLLDTPALLVQQEDFVLLHDIQKARADLHNVYQYVLSFRTALRRAREGGHTGCGPADADGTVFPAPDIPVHIAEVWHGAPFAARRVRDNIFGAVNSHAVAQNLLEPGDLSGRPTGCSDADLDALLNRTDNTIAFLLEVFLWQEWFLREVPFVLSEHIGSVVERIRQGVPIPVNTAGFSDPAERDRLRNTLGIFCECTRQGIYLTDVLLTHVSRFPREEWPEVIRNDLTRRRVMVSDGSLVYHPGDPLARHLQFTTFAHDYRYGKESLEHPSLLCLWLKYVEESNRVEETLKTAPWPALPRHPDLPHAMGPLHAQMYEQQAADAVAFLELIVALHERARRDGFEIRVIPNLTYGLFCVAPIMDELLKRGIHVSFAGISSRFCDDENISRFSLLDENVFPLKRYVFSNASNYGTLNGDRILIVIDGTMEPLDRHDASKIRLPKAYRGFVNHLAAVNYVRARFGYGMENAERDVASALHLPLHFVSNLVRTHGFRHLLDSLLHCFDPDALTRAHAVAGTGRTYYTFSQWNADGMSARVGPLGYRRHDIPCANVPDLPCPSLLFVSMNSIFNKTGTAAYFDNNPEVEHPRMFIGPRGVKIDIGWPRRLKGIQLTLS